MLKWYYFGYTALSRYIIIEIIFFLFLFSFLNTATRKFSIIPTADIMFPLELNSTKSRWDPGLGPQNWPRASP